MAIRSFVAFVSHVDTLSILALELDTGFALTAVGFVGPISAVRSSIAHPAFTDAHMGRAFELSHLAS